MKKHSFLYLILFGFAILGCKKDDDDPNDVQSPEVEITSPLEDDELNVAQGSTFDLEGHAEDNDALATLTYSIELEEASAETGTPWAVSEQTVPEFDPGTSRYNFDFPLIVPANARPGVYLITVHAEDQSSNTAEATTRITVTEDDDDNNGGNGDLFNITLNAPEERIEHEADIPLNVTGNAHAENNWRKLFLRIETLRDPTALYEYDFSAAAGRSDYNFQHEINIPESIGQGTYYIIVSGEDMTGEKVTVARQIFISRGIEDIGSVVFRLVGLPENTPEEARIYLTGDLEDDILMQRDEDGVYFATLEGKYGVTIRYNYYRGREGSNEVDSEGNPIEHRLYTFTYGEEIVEDTVERWGDLAL